VSLVCGFAGAWGYWSFFESARSKEHDLSGETSDSVRKADSANSETSPNKLLQAETAWKAAVKQRDSALAAEQVARRSEGQTKAVLDLLKKTLLSAGRPGDASLAEAFWTGGQGRDVTLRKAVDATEAEVARTFADRPLGEASVRELLGAAYMNLGDAPRAVTQYERALALREAMQGASHPDAADCRNQLAVAYRLAGRTDDASRLFESDPDSAGRAKALAVRGSMLLLQKNPAQAELALRECLRIRQSTQPDDWTTYETKSTLGEALLDQQKFADAEPLLLSGYEGMKKQESRIHAEDKPRVRRAALRLAELYDAWGKKAEATKWRKETEAMPR
jgi:tetratricopeptide (TPR) repeat protein